MEERKLIEYLKNVVLLEKMCYEQRCILQRLKRQLNYYSDPENELVQVDRVGNKPQLRKYICWNVFFPSEFGVIWLFYPIMALIFVALLLPWLLGLNELFSLSSAAKVIFIVIPIICYAIQRLIEFHKYKADCRTYEKRKANTMSRNRKIVSKNKNTMAKFRFASEKLQCEVDAIYAELKKTEAALSKYYSLDIIYPKYQNFACVSSILEYFLSGRCHTLTGHEGAYNILEAEMFQRTVITKLDDVIDSLEDIKNNQYMLYDAINDCTRSVNNVSNRIISSTERLSNKITSANRETNSRLDSIDYVNRINARNVQVLAELEAYKMLLN